MLKPTGAIREIIKQLEGLQRFDHDGIHGVYPHRDGDLVNWQDIKDIITEINNRLHAQLLRFPSYATFERYNKKGDRQ